LLLVMALAPAGAQAKLYFSAFLGEGGTGIERAGFEGGGLETLQFEPSGFEDGIAIDTAAGKMYWTDTDASVISSANLNGTDAQIVLDDFGAEPLGIALDVAEGKMYWTDREGVKRANLDGSEVELLTKEPARGFISLDLAARQMYWADWPSGDIKTAAMTPEATVTDLVTKQSAPFGVAVDEAGEKVIWLDLDLEKKKTEKDEIRSANLDGGEVQTLVERPGAGFEGGLAIEPSAGKLYWTEAEAHDIGVSNLDGSQAQTLFSTGEDIPEGLAVESVNPHPTNTAPPAIEGSAEVGSPLSCNPGTWTGTGPLSFAYQWEIVGQGAIEGATGSGYVPSEEEAGSALDCVVTAADDVETSVATSVAVTVAPFGGATDLPAAGVVETQLVAGISVATLMSSGTRARVPVFTSLPGAATLTATPIGRPRAAARKKGRAARAAKHARSSDSASPRTIKVHRSLAAGRATITLTHLVPGTAYRLVLRIQSTGGGSASDTATLKVARSARAR
jgi:hypothetical protein